MIDAYSKWMEIDRVKRTLGAVAIKLIRQFFPHFGISHSILSDSGECFVSDFFKKFCEEYQIKHTRTTPYYIRSNGSVEKLIRTFKNKFYTERQNCDNKNECLTRV